MSTLERTEERTEAGLSFVWMRVKDEQGTALASVGGDPAVGDAWLHLYDDSFSVHRRMTVKQLRQMARALLDAADCWEARA